MAIFNHNMDRIVDLYLPLLSHEGIAATHCCVCNLDKDPWCPSDWTQEKCVFSSQKNPDALNAADVPSSDNTEAPATHQLVNSGLILFRPSRHVWKKMVEEFKT